MFNIKKFISSLLMVVLVVTQLAGTQNIAVVNAQTGVTPLECVIVSGGNFNTGIFIDENYKVEMRFSLSTLSQYKDIICAAMGNSYVYRLRNESTSGFVVQYGWYKTKSAYMPQVNQEIVFIQDGLNTYVNGKQVQKASKVQDLKATQALKFGDLTGSIKGLKVWDADDKLVADYIPVSDANKTACMYNRVTGQLCYYSGICKAGERTEAAEEPEVPEVFETVENNEKTENNNQTEFDNTDTTETKVPESNSNSSSADTVNYIDGLELNGGNFDSGKLINQNYSSEITFSLSNLNQYKNLYYASVDSKNYVYRLRLEAAKGLFAKHGWYNQTIYVPKADEEITVLQKKSEFYVNGTQKLKATLQTLEAGYTLKFGDFAGTIKAFKLWDGNGNLVADYRPVLDNSNKACMYDNVNRNYVYYSGTCKAIVEKNEEASETVTEELQDKTETSTEIETEVIEDSMIENDTEAVETFPAIEKETIEESKVTSSVKRTIEDELYDMFATGDMGKRDVSSYKVTLSEFYGLWPEFKEKNYLLATNGRNVYPDAEYSGNYVTNIRIVNMDADYVQRYNRVLVAVDEFLAGVDDKMSDLDKTVWAHEFIVQHVTYKNTGKLAHTAAGALGDNESVCQGYALAMNTLLKLVGVETKYVSSSGMQHGWTYVKINNEWYHVDPTWDDTRKGTNEIYAHRYLLRNDKEFEELSHYGWNSEGATSVSERYTNWFVHDVAGRMYYSNGLWYYYDRNSNSIKASDINGVSSRVIVDGEAYGSTIEFKGISSSVLTYTVGGKVYTLNL